MTKVCDYSSLHVANGSLWRTHSIHAKHKNKTTASTILPDGKAHPASACLHPGAGEVQANIANISGSWHR